jgi:hypothetical protein
MLHARKFQKNKFWALLPLYFQSVFIINANLLPENEKSIISTSKTSLSSYLNIIFEFLKLK